MMRPLGASHDAEARVGGRVFVVALRDCRGDFREVNPKDVILQTFLEIVCPICSRTFYVRAPAPEVVPRAAAAA